MTSGNDETARTYPLRIASWAEIPGLVHGFLGRAASLGSGSFSPCDLHARLAEAGEQPSVVLAARQVHGADVLGPEQLDEDRAPDAALPEALPAGDALVSASADVILTIRTADCVPILLMAERARAVAAVHAGWRGTLAGVVESAIVALGDRYAARPGEIRAAIGPAIDGCCYEFGAEPWDALRHRFGSAIDPAWRASSGSDRGYLDLRRVLRHALAAAGVPADAIEVVGPCTAHQPGELHSYRRDGAHAGRQLSYVGWRAS